MTEESRRAWFTAHLRDIAQDTLGLTEVDGDGDWVVRGQTSQGWLRLFATGPGGLVAEMVAAVGVPEKLAVFRELNNVNAVHPAVRLALREDGVVVASWFLPLDAVTPEVVAFALQQVGDAADHVGPLLTAVHGGSVPHPQSSALGAREA